MHWRTGTVAGQSKRYHDLMDLLHVGLRLAWPQDPPPPNVQNKKRHPWRVTRQTVPFWTGMRWTPRMVGRLARQ